MLDLDLRVEEELVIEAVAGVDDGPQKIELGPLSGRLSGFVLAGEVFEEHLAIAGERDTPAALVRRRCGWGQPERARVGLGELKSLLLAAAESLHLLGEHVETSLELCNVGRSLLAPGGNRLGLHLVSRIGLLQRRAADLANRQEPDRQRTHR